MLLADGPGDEERHACLPPDGCACAGNFFSYAMLLALAPLSAALSGFKRLCRCVFVGNLCREE